MGAKNLAPLQRVQCPFCPSVSSDRLVNLWTRFDDVLLALFMFVQSATGQ